MCALSALYLGGWEQALVMKRAARAAASLLGHGIAQPHLLGRVQAHRLRAPREPCAVAGRG